MRCLRSLLPLATLPLLGASLMLHCDNLGHDGATWDITPLDGEFRVHHFQDAEPGWAQNTTYTISVCRKLKRPPKPDGDFFCDDGTRACAQRFDVNEDGSQKEPLQPHTWAVAGEYPMTTGRTLDPKVTRLKGSASHQDNEREGFRLELHGGEHLDKTKARVVIEFLCDHNKTGLEGTDGDADKLGLSARSDDASDEPEDKRPDPDKGKSLQFKSYEAGDPETLRLIWTTKYACEDQKGKDKPTSPSKGGWGFFTWFIIILFLAIASYLIFGSWLNYNRYGARGWDLLPHGDTIRDLPYLLKDWARRVVSTVQGSGSRDLGYIRV